ncbi:tripartite tricarboxylate transporter substrate binding protein [Hydrogenophaga sp. 2FB]|uniref:Bug family tripartite tricarboxylate transporter substrate binding protein n=1 Tax=Hydrogenophaga sp. 2FB TaxID=2502187 RepID=UPI0010F5B925|nr:tripartite tricarboxylate transporter substrate binding protein [Hydrogenophaga sp. 2FB]
MRTRNLITTTLTIAALAWSTVGLAQDYPNRPITFVLPAPPGGATDAISRALAAEMSKSMKQPIVVDNRPGAAGMLGTGAVARAAPDGYTILVAHSSPVAYAPYMFAKVPYDVQRDLAPITEICSASLVFTVSKSVPATTMKEFIDWAGKNKGKVSYGSFGVGSSSHLLNAYLSESHKLGMTHVAYKGEAPMALDIMSDQVQAGIGTLGTMAPYLISGKLRALALIGDERLKNMPDLPTMAEAGLPDAEYRPLGGMVMMAPAGTPAPILAMLEKEARAAIQSTNLRARFQVYGLVGMGNTAAQFRHNLEASAPVIQKLIKVSGAKVE